MKISKTFEIKNGEELVKLHMSFGMLSELMRLTGCDNPETAAQISLDLNARELIVRRLLTVDMKKPLENFDDLVNAFDLELEAEDVNNLIEWVQEHFLDFFVQNFAKIQALSTKFQETGAVKTAKASLGQ